MEAARRIVIAGTLAALGGCGCDAERILAVARVLDGGGNPGDAGPDMKAKCPLADAKVEVREVKGKPGWYEAVAWLRPHFQLETLTTSMRLVAEVPKKG